MINPFASVALGAGLALSLAVPPGPINAMMASVSVSNGGALKGTAIGFGAITADATYLALVLLLHDFIPPVLEKPLALVGGCFLLFIGYSIIRGDGSNLIRFASRGYISGVLVGLTNPYQLGWWLTAGLSMVEILGYSSAAGFFGALFVWVFAFPFTLNKITRRYGGSISKVIRFASGIAVIGFGFFFIFLAVFGMY
jgi:threonine/homoserine/homoserine lactone efflux protein